MTAEYVLALNDKRATLAVVGGNPDGPPEPYTC